MAGRRGINPTQGQKKNISYIKELIYEYSPISRAEIAERLSLTPATITNNVAILMESGLIQEKLMESTEDNPVGRRPIMLEFIPDAKYVIGIEISARGLFLVICNILGEEIYKVKSNYYNEEYDEIIEYVAQCIEEGLKITNISPSRLIGLGAGIPRFVDRKEGDIKTGFWADWEYDKLKKDLELRIGLNTCVDNNASVRALAEGLFERINLDSFAYLFVSRGIACPLMIKNDMISRELTGVGEIGHMVVDIHGTKCERCGDHGCLDTFSGERAIRKKCIAIMERNEDTLLKKIAENPLKPTIEEIIEASSQGDEIIDEVLDTAIKYLAVGICNIIKFISPELVVVDAYILSLQKWRKQFLYYIEKHLSENKWNKVSFIFKEFDEYSGAKGSAAYAIKKFLIDSE